MPSRSGPEYDVFCHNDIQENNYLHNPSETKIIDFEYSQINVRGFDLAQYINECYLENNNSLPHFYDCHLEAVPDFDAHKPGTVDIDFVI